MTPHDEWDYDGVNEMILTDQKIDGKDRKLLTHFDRNGFGYTLDRVTGELLVAQKFDPKVNWATGINMDKYSPDYGKPIRVKAMSTEANGEDVNTKGICPAALGSKDEQPAAYSIRRPSCSTCRPTTSAWTTSRSRSATPPASPMSGRRCRCIRRRATATWATSSPGTARPARSSGRIPSSSRSGRGALATAGGVVFYGTLEGYLKAVDAKTGKVLYKFKTPSGIIGNVMTYEHGGSQYVAVLSGVGGWAGIGLAAGLTEPHDGLGAVGGYAALATTPRSAAR